jgi:hypothetical protein
MAIWNQNRYIVGGLILVILGHWSLILQGQTPRIKPFIFFIRVIADGDLHIHPVNHTTDQAFN